MGNITENTSFLSKHLGVLVPIFTAIFIPLFGWLFRWFIMFLSPTLGVEVLKGPSVSVVAELPGATLIGDPPVYLNIEFDIRSWIKSGFWRHLIRLVPLGIRVITCEAFGSKHLSLDLSERPQFADESNLDVKSTIKFSCKLADSNKQPGQIIIEKIQLKVDRKAEKTFKYSFSIAKKQQIFEWKPEWIISYGGGKAIGKR